MKPIDKYLVIENKLAKTDRDERMNELIILIVKVIAMLLMLFAISYMLLNFPYNRICI